MKNLLFVGFFVLALNIKSYAQTLSTLAGAVIDRYSELPINGAEISFLKINLKAITIHNGQFTIENVPKGIYQIRIFSVGYEDQLIQIDVLDKEILHIGHIFLKKKYETIPVENLIRLSEDDLTQDDKSGSTTISGLFQSSKDAYLKAASFNFSQAWFKVKGFDSRFGKVLINGVEMNKIYDGRPQWSNWGGLNDVLRNQEFSNGLLPSENSFGILLGTTNFKTRASEYRKGGKLSYATTNKSYTHRFMGMYASGLTENNWAFSVAGSRRMANEGYREGASYNAWSGFLSVEKKLSAIQSVNLTLIGAFNRRGKSSPNTKEVYDLKGLQYNSYWGYQMGAKRNERMKEIFEPIVMLNHFYKFKKGTLNSSLTFQTGYIENSRLGYFNAANPSPTYWKYLPSSFLRDAETPDYSGAYISEQEFLAGGQLNWKELYQTNTTNGRALYYLYDDRTDDAQFNLNSVLNLQLKDHVNFSAGISLRKLASKNYGLMSDLLGGADFIDLDQYAIGTAQQNDLNQLNRVINAGDKFQYNYVLNASNANFFSQFQVAKKSIDYFIGLNLKYSKFFRNGLYKNGTYPNNSFGESEKPTFFGFGVKSGFTYKITGRHLFEMKGAYFSNAPLLKHVFTNVRVNNLTIPNVSNEQIVSTDMSYVYRSSKIQSRITGYYSKFMNSVENSFFFAEGLKGDQADFVSEIMTDIEKKHLGVEWSTTYQLLPAVKLIAAGSVGRFSYNNNPNLFIQSESFRDEKSDFGKVFLKNYKISGTPQNAYSFGLEYNDPDFWWVQINWNHLSNNYIDVAAILRTKNFYQDADGVPFIDPVTGVEITKDQVAELLVQERFKGVNLVNIVGGKSWKIHDNYTGFFIGLNNVFGQLFKTGGFEQSRNANYLELLEDRNLNRPIFGNKYWYGNKASFYINFYIRF